MSSESENVEEQFYLQKKNENNFVIASTYIVIVQFVVIIALVIGILFMFPLKEKIPYFVQFSNNQDNFVYVQKANAKLLSNQNVVNYALSNYIVARGTINFIDDTRRQAIIKSYSANDVFLSYSEIFNANQKAYKNSNFNRKIDILTVSNINNNVVIVNIKMTDYENLKVVKRRIFKVSMHYSFKNLKLNFNEATVNPLGMVIQKYNIQRIKTNSEGKQI